MEKEGQTEAISRFFRRGKAVFRAEIIVFLTATEQNADPST
jgi:hypothetical protein